MFFKTGMFNDSLKKYLTHKLICQWLTSCIVPTPMGYAPYTDYWHKQLSYKP